ncbi:MAG: cyclic pyranopterin monophosphate synthase MoaC [Pontixanthobacter sp.]
MMKLTHLDEHGTARMVDVGGKAVTRRSAVARGYIEMSAATVEAVSAGDAPKGDVLGTARLAGIMAAKKTAELIPLCHPLAIDAVEIEFDVERSGILATATVALDGKTGVEMEALTAASIALLTIYDMAKAIDKKMMIGRIELISKTGGSHL